MPRIRSTGWAQCPYPLLDQAGQPGGKQRLVVYLWLHRHSNRSEEGCYASIATLAREAGMAPRDVKAALRWLLEEGWVERHSIPGRPSHYWVRADAPDLGPKRDLGAKSAPGPKSAPGGGAQKGPTNKNPGTRTHKSNSQEPPTPPSGGNSRRSTGANPRQHGANPRAMGMNPRSQGTNPRSQTQPVHDANASDSLAKPDGFVAHSEHTTPDPMPTAQIPAAPPARSKRDPLAARQLPADAIPADLAHLTELLTDWWATKPRGRTTVAFNRACQRLRQYPVEGQREMLENATIGGHQGLYPPRQQNGNGLVQRGASAQFLPPLHGARPTRTEVAAANVLAAINAASDGGVQ